MHEKVLAKNYVLKKGIQIIIYFKQENALSRQSVFMKLIDYFVRFFTIASIAHSCAIIRRGHNRRLRYILL